MTTQHELATRFHGLHDPAAPLALANVWDVASARIVAASGAAAIATTSAGVAWGLGTADGNHLDRKPMLETLTRIVAAVDVPVTADIESGFGDTPGRVAHSVAQVVRTGTVGVNIEDSQPGATSPEQSLRPIVEQARRIEAARAAADSTWIPLYINARIDVFIRRAGAESERLAATLERARAYLDAGASGIFVIGVTDAETIAALTAGINAPVNVSGTPGSLSVAELGRLGVARVSMGASIAEAAYEVVDRAARELLTSGTYESVREALDYPVINGLMEDAE